MGWWAGHRFLCEEHCFDGRKKGFKVKALKDAMRAVNLKPGDDERAIEEMRVAGAEIVE